MDYRRGRLNLSKEQGNASPVDCWELVGSGPSSPLPEATVDRSALEEAMAAACACGASLHDDYFLCLSDHEVLPLSMVTAERQSEEEGCSSNKSDALVSLDSDTEAGENASSILPTAKIDDYNEGIGSTHCVSHVQYGDDVPHDKDMYSFGMILDEHFDVSGMNDVNYGMHISDVIDRADIYSDTYNHDSVHENVQLVNESHVSGDVAELMATTTHVHELLTSVMSRSSESSNSSHCMSNDSIDIRNSAEECHSPTALGDVSRESAGQADSPTASGDVSRESAGQAESSVDMQRSIIDTNNSRQCKVFACASWLWTQLSRWQAQLGYANTLWSVALAAAVMGILVLGRGWQCLQSQNYSLRSQLWAKEKRITELMFQLMQAKESLAKSRRVPVICVKPALQIPQGHV